MLAGELSYGLVARTEGLKRGFREAKREMNSLKDYSTRTLGSIGSTIGATIAGIATIATAKAAISSIIDEALRVDDLVTRATIIGTTAQELSSLRYAATQSDVSVQGFEKSLIKMRKSIGDAGDGLKTAKDALAALHISQEEIVQQDASTQFLTIASALRAMKNQTLQTKYAMDLLGRSGSELLPIIRGSAADFEKYLEEGKRLSSSLTEQNVKAAQKVDESIKRLKQSWENFKISFVGSFGTGISSALEGVSEYLSGPELSTPPVSIVDYRNKSDEFKARLAELEARRAGLQEAANRQNSIAGNIGKYAVRDPVGQLKEINEQIERYKSAIAEIEKAIQNRAAAAKQAASTEAFLNDWRETLNQVSIIKPAIDAIRSGGVHALEDLSMKARIMGQDLASAFRLDHARRYADFIQSLADQAQAIKDAIKSPLDQFNEDAKRVKDLMARDLLTEEEAKQYLRKRRDELGIVKSIDTVEPVSVGALSRGSSEAAAAIADFARFVTANDVNEDILAESKKQNDSLDDITDNTRRTYEEMQKIKVVDLN